VPRVIVFEEPVRVDAAELLLDEDVGLPVLQALGGEAPLAGAHLLELDVPSERGGAEACEEAGHRRDSTPGHPYRHAAAGRFRDVNDGWPTRLEALEWFEAGLDWPVRRDGEGYVDPDGWPARASVLEYYGLAARTDAAGADV